MPQLDIALFLSIIISLSIICTLVYGFILVQLFFPFVSRIKASYFIFRMVKQFKIILIGLF